MATLPRFESEEMELRFKILLYIAMIGFLCGHASEPPPPHPSILRVPLSTGKAKGRIDTTYAFPSADDAYDHSPAAKLDINLRELLDAPPPRQRVSRTEVEKMTMEEFNNMKVPTREGPQGSTALGASGLVNSFAFGAGNSTWTCICSDAATRSTMRAHHLFDTPLYIEPHSRNHPFRIASTDDGRGKGVFATRAIARGDVVVREPPLLVVEQAVHPGFIATMDQYTDYAMHPRAKVAFDALHDCWPPNAVTRRFGIMRTNQFSVELPLTSKGFGATFEILSRINHSCAPNSKFEWDVITFQGKLIADKDIRAGEEILVTYSFDLFASKSTRREELQRKYNFKCTCKRCGPN